MAINRVDYPANLTAQADFSAHGELIETRFMDQVNAPQWVVSGNIPQGVVLQIGAVVYRADSDTAITGTASDYVKITPSGATAAAAYVASLTGVTWSAQYNGYYDASSNLYLFDEGKALKDSPAITALLTRYVTRTEDGDTYIGRDLDVERNFTARGTAGITGNTTVGGTLGVTGNTTVGGNANIIGELSEGGDGLFYRRITGSYAASGATEGSIFTALSPYIPNDGDTLLISGRSVNVVSTTVEINHYNRAIRQASNQIILYGTRVTTAPFAGTIVDNVFDGNAAVWGDVSFAW